MIINGLSKKRKKNCILENFFILILSPHSSSEETWPKCLQKCFGCDKSVSRQALCIELFVRHDAYEAQWMFLLWHSEWRSPFTLLPNGHFSKKCLINRAPSIEGALSVEYAFCLEFWNRWEVDFSVVNVIVETRKCHHWDACNDFNCSFSGIACVHERLQCFIADVSSTVNGFSREINERLKQLFSGNSP